MLKTLCKRVILETAARQPVFKYDGELVHRSAPVGNRHCPPFADISQGEIQNLEHRFVRGKHHPVFDDFPSVQSNDLSLDSRGRIKAQVVTLDAVRYF